MTAPTRVPSTRNHGEDARALPACVIVNAKRDTATIGAPDSANNNKRHCPQRPRTMQQQEEQSVSHVPPTVANNCLEPTVPIPFAGIVSATRALRGPILLLVGVVVDHHPLVPVRRRVRPIHGPSAIVYSRFRTIVLVSMVSCGTQTNSRMDASDRVTTTTCVPPIVPVFPI